ncbi:MAG TPA: alpha/beta fold hydrolase [Acidobacteriaceae bacterium]|nr:alpha/beta fold hydrolase [Acidobacteriaceae bacterium]
MKRPKSVLAAALCTFLIAIARPAFPEEPLTVEQLFHQPSLLAGAPDNLLWSPDGARLIYLAEGGDLMAVEGASGAQRVLVSRSKMRTFTEAAISERDRSARARYHEAIYSWVPDSRHVLFDAAGQLWFFDTSTGTGLQLVSTGAGSGDDPQFSPDGSTLTYVRDHNLYAYKIRESGMTVKLTDSGSETVTNGAVDWLYEEELDVRRNYFWAPDSRHVAYLQTNEASVPEYPIEDWIPSHAKVNRQPYPQPGDPNPEVRIGVVSGSGGRTKWINLPIDIGNDYIPRFGWLNAKTLWIETLTRDHKKLELYFADILTDAVQPVLTKSDEKFLDESYDVKIAEDNILLTGWRDGHNHIYLYRYHSADPLSAPATLVKQLTSGDWEVAEISAVDTTTKTVYYLSNEGDPRQQQIWAIHLDGTGKRKVSSSGGWHDPVFSRNAKFFADTVSSAATPPVVNLCHHESSCAPIWKAPETGVTLLARESLEMKASDSKTTLYGELVLPPGKTEPRSVPLILNPYGGPHAQMVTDEWNARARLFDQILAEHGFAVLRVDNRGMGGRGRDFAQAAFHNFGPVQFGDQMACLDQVLARYPQLDPNRLGWWGWSWGGTFTLYAMTHTDRFRAGVSVAPVSNWRDYDSTYTERYLGQPESDAEVYQEDSVVNAAAKLSGRLLLAQGTGDDNVHLENAVQFIQNLIDANLPYDLQIYPQKTHSIEGAEARTHLYSRILSQFEMYLKPAAGPGRP